MPNGYPRPSADRYGATPAQWKCGRKWSYLVPAGAAQLAAHARRELPATSARPRRAAVTGPDALTSAERRVAGLASRGLSNRQIAEHLFISQATVETHLRHAFHKLGISSRADLPAGN